MSLSPTFAGITAQWLTDALRAGGHTEAPVISVSVEEMAFTGATTDMGRLRIAYAEDGATRGPATLVAKIRGTRDVQVRMDEAMGLYAREASFYGTFADHVPVEAPGCFHIGDGDAEPLLLEDLGSMRMGDQIDGISLADAEAVIDALADLHAAFWESEQLQQPWLASPGEGVFAAMIEQLVASGAPALAERYAGKASDAVLAAVIDAAPTWSAILRRGAEGPSTLVHNDCRLDNLFFGSDGRPRFIDWQVAARTRGTQDVGNLLAGSMNADDVSVHWEPLLRRYHERLLAGEVTGYSFDQCVEHYRQNIVYPLGAGMALIGIMDIGDGRGLGDVIITRCLRHIAELDSFAVL